MSGPTVRLAGPRVALVPASVAVAAAVVACDPGALAGALAALDLEAGPGWPHEDTVDALRPLTEPGAEPGESACWLIAERGAVVGDCGWRPGGHSELELGYGLAAPARGRGLATEAVGVLATWADRQPGIELLTAEVLVGNGPSRRLLSRLGFVADGGRADHVRLVRPVRPGGAPRRLTGRHVC